MSVIRPEAARTSSRGTSPPATMPCSKGSAAEAALVAIKRRWGAELGHPKASPTFCQNSIFRPTQLESCDLQGLCRRPGRHHRPADQQNTWPSAANVEVLKIDTDKRKDLAERKRLINASDVTFLCLPDEAAAVGLAGRQPGTPASSTPPPRIASIRRGPSACRNWPGSARQDQASKRIANLGCCATAFILASAPCWSKPGCCRPPRRSLPTRSPATPAAVSR